MPRHPARLSLIAAFVTLYIVWGSTYLAIRYAVETIPPFLLSGSRFVLAGAALMLWSRLRGVKFPTVHEWRGSTAVGLCLVLLSNVPVVWAEQHIASGVVALFAAATPLLIALLNRRQTGARLGPRQWLGLGLGTAGIAVLGSATFSMVPEILPLAVLALASISWAIGSTYGRAWGQPKDLLMASAAQMLAGGVLAVVASLVSGEFATVDFAAITVRSIVAWSYLALIGSLLAYPVFQWLLRVGEPTAVSSYTYVNPVIALSLGAIVAHEPITTRTIAATLLLLPAVGLVVTSRKVVLPPEKAEQ